MNRGSPSILFVYGTLRKGFTLHSHLDKSTIKYLGKGLIQGRLYDLGEYPGAVRSSGNTTIIGEVYELGDSKELDALDKIEEFYPEEPKKSLFVRQKTNVKLESGKEILAWVYLLPKKPKHAQLVKSGDYKKRDFQR
jgi:gamma-glutamylcyclotransferase (GGCT)/AIG2-like uncharacterized protein YtfP